MPTDRPLPADHDAPAPSPARATAGLLGAGLLLNLLWLGPDAADPRTDAALRVVPEAWLLVGLFALLPAGRTVTGLRWAAAVGATLLLAATFGNVAVEIALGRSLTLPGDIGLLVNGYNLLDGQFGAVAALGAALLAAVLALALSFGVTRLLAPREPRRPAIALTGVAAGLLALHAAAPLSTVTPHAWAAARLQVDSALVQRRALEQLRAELDRQPGPTALPGLADGDVWLVWIESYAASANRAPAVAGVLDRHSDRLSDAGFVVASGLLEAPIRGGQSWLSHATLLAGLDISDQTRYRTLLEHHTSTLAHDFAATGHATAAVMPAILENWPEGERLGFEHRFDAAALDYRGPGLGWVTMPDEFTLDRAARTVRPRLDGPTFIQVALISSHAPWQPVLPLLGPDTPLDDGRAFAPFAGRAPGPGAMHEPVERLRQRYHDALAYSLDAAFGWAAETLGPDDLLLIVGDHPPAPLIAADPADARVPVHVLSRDPALVDVLAPLAPAPGLEPDLQRASVPMHAVRKRLHAAFDL
ncbi:hypothetical protein HFP89_05260 [Wenzhouxiangella sp. XN79A]|uniref:sulfatase-like hydrolase/transferase n=1 Tax=Wenzhouxiangella sp. XN79A TaxID=2724193 RepID=UPI00144AB3E9|nr:sulfatase-like hydrolase/transferase [Wenzhouxiangella sp. XN79A]NKI34570.1 hypothetical protein [Wenzhouxiangella sp. XN79A]